MKMDGVTVQTKYFIKRVPERGPHPLWCVYEKTDDASEMICGCTYLKGAEALVERLCETDRRIARLKTLTDAFKEIKFVVKA